MLENAYNLMKVLNEEGIFFCFNGPFSETILVETGDVIKERVKQETTTTTMMRIFSVFVEMLQNINYYSADRMESQKDDADLGLGVIFIGRRRSDYFMMSGNLIENRRVERLKEKLAKLAGMNRTEIRKFYKKCLRNESLEEGSRGAGLGLIEIARNVSEPIQYNFQQIDDSRSFFSLTTFISKDDVNATPCN